MSARNLVMATRRSGALLECLPQTGDALNQRLLYLVAVDRERVAQRRRSTFLGLPGYGD